MNRELALAGEAAAKGITEDARGEVAMDLRVVIEWDREDVRLGLIVLDPMFEKLSADRPASPEGAVVIAGLEELWAKDALAGRYEIRLRRFVRDWDPPMGDTVARVRAYQNWGRPSQSVETWIVRVPPGRGEILVGEVSFSR